MFVFSVNITLLKTTYYSENYHQSKLEITILVSSSVVAVQQVHTATDCKSKAEI